MQVATDKQFNDISTQAKILIHCVHYYMLE